MIALLRPMLGMEMRTAAARGTPTDFPFGVCVPEAFGAAAEVDAAYRQAVARFDDVLATLVGERFLSVLVFRRKGWTAADYQAWSDRILDEEFAFVVPTNHDGETLARFAVVNPQTTTEDIVAILDSMA